MLAVDTMSASTAYGGLVRAAGPEPALRLRVGSSTTELRRHASSRLDSNQRTSPV